MLNQSAFLDGPDSLLPGSSLIVVEECLDEYGEYLGNNGRYYEMQTLELLPRMGYSHNKDWE